MSRQEYMEQLAYLLQDIAESEREEALQYYRDYFEDAGVSEEENVIATLGSPEKVAAMIKDGLGMTNKDAGEYTESGYQDERFREDNKVPQTKRTNPKESYQEENRSYHSSQDRRRGKGSKLLLLVLICILGLPIILPVLGILLGVVFGGLGLIFGLGISAFAMTIAGLVSGIVMIVSGIVKIFAVPHIGFLLIGVGFIVLAIGILMMLVVIWLIKTVIPAVLHSFTNFCGRIFRRKERS